MQNELFTLLVDKDEVSWKSIIQDLVRSEKMDPWDVNITQLAKQYITRVRQMQRMDLQVSGKVVLAASLLLKIKSNKLLGEDLLEFDRLLAPPADESDFYEDLQMEYSAGTDGPAASAAFEDESFPIYSRTPQARRRKVSVYDLLEALEKALEVKHRRENKLSAVEVEAPEKQVNIGIVLKGLFAKIKMFFGQKKEVTFEGLLEGESREEKVKTFIPLLYLSNEQKVRLEQDDHYGSIRVLPGEAVHAK